MKRIIPPLFLFISSALMGQTQLPLSSMEDFRSQAGNWRIVGDVVIDRNLDIHHQEAEPAPTPGKKKKKKNSPPPPPPPKAVTYSAGTGILLNDNDDVTKDNLLTVMEHGDIRLELDMMIPKGSNSGIYLQGRYEIQLLDSWGVKQPGFTDIGGIFRNWQNEPGKKFAGIPPSSNPAKAPGTWQHFDIHFRAPRFDTGGNKVENARLVYVELNGVRIHENVEIPLPTGGAIAWQEVAKGPLMIQGDHGPVAFRNIKYQLMEESGVELENIAYKAYEGEFKTVDDFKETKPIAEGNSENINVNLTTQEDAYAISFSGDLIIPKDDEYIITTGHTGGILVLLDGKSIINDQRPDGRGELSETLTLTAGTHSLNIYCFKSAPWMPPRLGMKVATRSTHVKALHSFESLPDLQGLISPIYFDPGAEPVIHRGFVRFDEAGPRLSHTVGVGSPSGVHFVYDLAAGNVIAAWRGDFVDATPMWHNRGDGSFRPNGAVQWTFLNQRLAHLSDSSQAFPSTGSAPDFKPAGYRISESSGLPIFLHNYKGVEVETEIAPSEQGTHLVQHVKFSQQGLTGWYLKLAEGQVRELPDGSFALDDQQYFINVLSGSKPSVREVKGTQELVMTVDGSPISFELIW